MTQRVKDAIDVFLDAINNGTLAKGICTACAVGNLVAHGMGGTITFKDYDFHCNVANWRWGMFFKTIEKRQHICNSDDERDLSSHKDLVDCVEATSFSLEEIMAIEYAFECKTSIYWGDYYKMNKEAIKQDQIKGLEAVIEVMLAFENDTETNVKEVFTDKVIKSY